jgi:hypothetical protein
MCAFAAVAPAVRFNALDIFVTPTFFFASDFSSRTSDEVQVRLTDFFLAILSWFLFVRTALLTHHSNLATRRTAPDFVRSNKDFKNEQTQTRPACPPSIRRRPAKDALRRQHSCRDGF